MSGQSKRIVGIASRQPTDFTIVTQFPQLLPYQTKKTYITRCIELREATTSLETRLGKLGTPNRHA